MSIKVQMGGQSPPAPEDIYPRLEIGLNNSVVYLRVSPTRAIQINGRHKECNFRELDWDKKNMVEFRGTIALSNE